MILSTLLALTLSQTPTVTPAEAHTGKSGMTVFVTAPQTSTVATVPTLAVNGQAVAMTAGPVSGAFWSFALAKPVLPSDALSVAAPSGWAKGAPALSMPVRNSTGQSEFPLPDRPTMALGVNVSQAYLQDGYPWSVPKNWATRLRPWNWNGLQVTAFDPQGNPAKLAGTVASTPFLSGAYPGHSGLWTIVWDSPDPKTAMTLGKGNNNGWMARPRPDLSSPGMNGVGITSVYEMVQGTSPDIGPTLALYVTHPAGTPSYSNLWIIPPGNSLDRSDPYAIDQRVLDKLAVGGGRGPSCIRVMDSINQAGGMSNVVNPEDIDVQRTITAQVTGLRPIDLAVSPTISTVYGATPIGDKGIFGSNSWIAEVITAQPHGFSTGQWMDIRGLPSFVCGDTTIPAAGVSSWAWVTSPTSFIFSAHLDSVGVNPKPYLDAPVDFTDQPRQPIASVRLNASRVLPLEYAAALAAQFPGCSLWLNIPAAATDATVDAMVSRVAKRLGPTNQLIIEYGNELWNSGGVFGVSYGYATTMGALLGLGRGWPDYYAVRRGGEVAMRAKLAFVQAGRSSDDVKLCLAGQFSWMAGRPLLSYAAKTGVKADVVAAAPYFSLPWAPSGWSVAQLHDLTRAFIALDPTPRSYFADYAQAIATYENAIGRRVVRAGYEGGVERMSASVASPWDWPVHPDAGLTDDVSRWVTQRAGFDMVCHFDMFNAPGTDGTSWGLWTHQGQLGGSGDGRDGRAVNQLTGSQVPGNVSVRGQAWRDWQRSYWLSR